MTQKRHIKLTLISLLLIVVLLSCTLSTTKHLIETNTTSTTFTNTYFSDTKRDYVYKANIDVYGKHFGGLMIVKKIANEHHRVVFTTEFGSKILDIEVLENDFKINFVLEELNKKIVLNTLKKDFKILVQENHTVEKTYSNDDAIVYQSKAGKRTNYFFVNDCSRDLKKIVNTSKTKEKVIITFEKTAKALAKEISIDHKNIKLSIDLKYLDAN
ncbi:MAG TPA: hypothetical protein DDZ39_00860 [Flavobacteriaceae bacterium]|jgi:hypothetical protein|nr:hypothetical protein [Flavobacteriaceae bacterium]